ncbi:MAG: YciC family protein [Gemmatimonadota bacterium]
MQEAYGHTMFRETLRAMSLSDLLDASFGVYRRLFVPLVFISTVAQAVPLSIGVFVEMSGGMMARPGLSLLGTFLSLILTHVGTAASTFMVAETYLGGTLTAQEAFRRAMPFVGRLVVLSFLSGLLYMVGLIALVVPGIIFICGLVVSAPAMVLEGQQSAIDAMRRSWSLTLGHKGRIFGALIVAFVLVLLPALALGTLVAMTTALTGSATAGLLVALLLQAVLSVLIYPFIYVVATLLYYDLRVRKEGYDLEMLESALQQA